MLSKALHRTDAVAQFAHVDTDRPTGAHLANQRAGVAARTVGAEEDSDRQKRGAVDTTGVGDVLDLGPRDYRARADELDVGPRREQLLHLEPSDADRLAGRD